MNQTNKMISIDKKYIVFLRGIAAIIVMISHILCNFWDGTARKVWEFLGITSEVRGLNAINPKLYLEKMNLDLGAIGVALFFLITGFLINSSMNKYKEPIVFLKKKILRIYPVYMIEFSVTFLMIMAFTTYYKMVFPYNISDWLQQVTLLRIFFWQASIDGISWTLVADMQMYLVITLLLTIKRADYKNLAFLSLLMSILSYFCSMNQQHFFDIQIISLFQVCSHLRLMSFCLSFMIIAVGVAEYDRGG